MIGSLSANIIRFVVLVLIQVVVLNNVQLSGYINPFLYVLFIVLLPLEVPRWLSLLLAFVLGLAVDIFTDTVGMHIAACLFMAYCRPFVLSILAPRGGYEVGSEPGIRDMGLAWFLSYAATLVFLHHLVLFFVEAFRFAELFTTLLRVLTSSVFTMLLIVIAQYLTLRPRRTE